MDKQINKIYTIAVFLVVLLGIRIQVQAQKQTQSDFISKNHITVEGGYNQSLFYCGAAKKVINSSFTSRDSYQFGFSYKRDVKEINVDQILRLGMAMTYKMQKAHFYYEEFTVDTVIPTGVENRVGVVQLSVFPQFVFGKGLRFLFTFGPFLEYVIFNNSDVVQKISGEFVKSKRNPSEDVRGLSLGGILGIGVELPITDSWMLGFSNIYTSGYTSKGGNMKKLMKYYNCFDIQLQLSMTYTF